MVKDGGQEHEKLSTKNTPLHGQVEALKERLADAEKRVAIAGHWPKNVGSTSKICAGCCLHRKAASPAAAGGRGKVAKRTFRPFAAMAVWSDLQVRYVELERTLAMKERRRL